MDRIFLFPGQGAHYPGMARDLWERHESVKSLFETASQAAAIDLRRLLFEGTEQELNATDMTQPALTLADLSAATALAERGIRPRGAAGFSLGEYAALAVAGVLAVEDVFRLVALRGRVMEKASRRWDEPEGRAGMAAAVGLDYPAVLAALGGLADVYAANYNSPQQTVVSGTNSGLAAAEAALKTSGVRRFIRLRVSGPFHCPLMEDARAEFESALEGVAFRDPLMPVYSNVTGEPISDGAAARRLCGLQMVSPVLWVQVERAVLAAGCREAYEVGPGTVLAGLWKALAGEPPCRPAGTIADIEAI